MSYKSLLKKDPTTIYCYYLDNNVLIANDAEKSTTNTSATKLKEIRITRLFPSLTKIRIYFELRSSNVLTTAYAQIYRNGSAYGTQRSTNSPSYVAFVEDLDFAQGDYVQLYVWSSSASYSVYVRNFRILGKLDVCQFPPSEAFSATNTLT